MSRNVLKADLWIIKPFRSFGKRSPDLLLLTWQDVMESVRSRSSTSCLNVGLWDGTACQQSLIIIYLQEEGHKIIIRSPAPSWQKSYHYYNHGSHSSWVHVEGRSMRWPSFSSLKSSSTGTPGYGEPPRVKISHSNTPKDHLTRKDTITMTIINRQRH